MIEQRYQCLGFELEGSLEHRAADGGPTLALRRSLSI